MSLLGKLLTEDFMSRMRGLPDTTTHTPTPWNTAGVSNPDSDQRMSVWGPISEGKQSGEWVAKDIRPANAAFIVRAVNAHEALVEALERTVAAHCPDDKMFCSTCSSARALLHTLSRGEQ